MTGDRLPGLQSLRGLAAVMVLIGHVIAEAEHYMGLYLPGDAIPWTRGVDIFFVISGFVITLSAARHIGQPGRFLWRRLLRVVPLYYLFTTLMIAVLLILPGGTKDTVLDPIQILSSYGFFPYERDDGRIAPVLSLGWTLNYEVFFYALFALCLALPRPLLALTALILGLGTVGLVADLSMPQLVFWTNPLILEFLFGVALARMWQAGWRLNRPLFGLGAFISGVALLVLLDTTDLPRFVAAGLPAMLIVASGSLFGRVRAATISLLGDSSYALYLSHRFSLRAATLLMLPLLPSTPTAAAVFVVMVCLFALAVGVLTHLWIERPMLRSFARLPQRVVA